MTGVVGLGQRALAGRQGPDVAARAAAFDQLGMQVTPANVLGIYSVIAEEAARLNGAIQMFRMDNFDGMPELGGDPVSTPAAKGFTEATNQLVAKCQADVGDLQSVAAGLAATARAYGNSEEQIKASFDPHNYRYQPGPPSPARPVGGTR